MILFYFLLYILCLYIFHLLFKAFLFFIYQIYILLWYMLLYAWSVWSCRVNIWSSFFLYLYHIISSFFASCNFCISVNNVLYFLFYIYICNMMISYDRIDNNEDLVHNILFSVMRWWILYIYLKFHYKD